MNKQIKLQQSLRSYLSRHHRLPTQKITIEEMNNYGYTWKGMLPLDKCSALQLFEENCCSIYLLYEDDTESLAIIKENILNHDGIFGIELTELDTMFV